MAIDFELEAANYNQRKVYEIWHDRFVKEYNQSPQARNDRKLLLGVPKELWDISFEYEVNPQWIRYNKNRTIGFVALQHIQIMSKEVGPIPLKIVSDVYVDSKFRNKGILSQSLLSLRKDGIEVILIDSKKLEDNIEYYSKLGFKYFVNWHEQNLLLVSPTKIDAGFHKLFL